MTASLPPLGTASHIPLPPSNKGPQPNWLQKLLTVLVKAVRFLVKVGASSSLDPSLKLYPGGAE